MSEKSSGFEIQSVIEQKLFENSAVQNFFEEWCRINDHIKPVVIDRNEWDEKETILEKRGDGVSSLFIPKDLHLWEMVGVVERVDVDTFSDKPERQDEAKQKMVNLGEILKNAGVYLAQRLGVINEGKGIAIKLAEQLFNYGESLVAGKRPDKPKTIDDILGFGLTDEETQKIDRFLAGDRLYESRIGKVSDEDSLENERQKTLAQFFRVSQKAFDLKERSGGMWMSSFFDKSEGWWLEKTGKVKPWQNGISIHEGFIKKIEKSLTSEIEKPRAELFQSIFRRGMDLLVKYLPFDKLPKEIIESYLYWQNGETILSEALQVGRLSSELNFIRAYGRVKDIGRREREITDIIQKVISKFQRQRNSSSPSKIIMNQEINCVGASILGGALMQEVGLNYLVGGVPEHSILFLVTADGQVEWRDMLNPGSNGLLTDEEIEGQKDNGESLTVADIVAFSENPKPEGLVFSIKSEEYRKKFPFVDKKGYRQFVSIFGPEYGQKMALLTNVVDSLYNNACYEQAIEGCHEALRLNPKDTSYFYAVLGESLRMLGRDGEAIEIYRKGIKINKNDDDLYLRLGILLKSSGIYDEAEETYREGIRINPRNKDLYNNLVELLSGNERYKEAVEVYREGIRINPGDVDFYNDLAGLFCILRDFNDATRVYREGMKNNPYNSDFYFAFGDYLREIGNIRGAVKVYRETLGWVDNKKYAQRIEIVKQIIEDYESKHKVRAFVDRVIDLTLG